MGYDARAYINGEWIDGAERGDNISPYNGEKIGTYAKLVDDRNEAAHSNGNIFYSTQAALGTKVREILRVVDEIQRHSKSVIEHCYREFLLRNHDPEEREYSDATDQIREVLIHQLGIPANQAPAP